MLDFEKLECTRVRVLMESKKNSGRKMFSMEHKYVFSLFSFVRFVSEKTLEPSTLPRDLHGSVRALITALAPCHFYNWA
ncbi:hypothetical protein H5410_055192 [Solanum commersonii]|uniref:Uncharacterized protein n=1 Tax=Solanum commersonii TaxID=4109 RepID=A0A9J5WHJ3_SOLCO|nr:hypothetical protein H5410_055192 [Solanum commersonii]